MESRIKQFRCGRKKSSKCELFLPSQPGRTTIILLITRWLPHCWTLCLHPRTEEAGVWERYGCQPGWIWNQLRDASGRPTRSLFPEKGELAGGRPCPRVLSLGPLRIWVVKPLQCVHSHCWITQSELSHLMIYNIYSFYRFCSSR